MGGRHRRHRARPARPRQGAADRARAARWSPTPASRSTPSRRQAQRFDLVAVDGGMSDNLRPDALRRPYEAEIADRVGAGRRPLHGGRASTASPTDVVVQGVTLRDPRAGDVLGHPGHRRLRLRDGQHLQRRAARTRGLLPRRRGPRWSCAARPTRTSPAAMSEPTPSASACSATAPSAAPSSVCWPSARTRSSPWPARGRRSSASSRARQGDFADILERSDLIVELMGGLEPAREYVLRAMRAGKHVVTANKQLLATHGEELWATAREHGVQLRFEGGRGRRRAGHPRHAGVAGRPRTWSASTASSTGRRTTSSPRWPSRASPTTRRSKAAQRARLRRGGPDRRRHRQGRRGQDGDPRPAGLRHARLARRRPLRGHRAHHGRRHGLRPRPRPRAEAHRHRRARRRRHLASACTRRSSTPAIRSPRSTARTTR